MASKAPALIILFFMLAPMSLPAEDGIIYAGRFSAAESGETLPAGWEKQTFKNIDVHTNYSLVKDGRTPVVKAVSNASSSGLIRKLRIDPETYPIIRWRWKIANIYQKGDVTKKQGDDYPARIYVMFAYDPEKVSGLERFKYKMARLVYGEHPPLGAITYIWASKAAVGTIISNPYTGRVKMVVVKSGSTEANRWVTEERNIYEDYTAAFGRAPPTISGVAIMTDSDNTGESATAFYGDILFTRKQFER